MSETDYRAQEPIPAVTPDRATTAGLADGTGSTGRAIVVGAGPVGLTAALALRSYGIPTTVIEAEPQERVRPGSRAIFFHKATLEALEEISPGLGFAFAEKGIVWPVKRTLFRGKEVYEKTYKPPTPGVLPPFTSLPQIEAEKMLFAACRKAEVEFIWNAPVQAVQTSQRGVTLTTADGRVFEVDYVIAADGSRSAVRKSVGIEMQGSRSANTFVVVDVQEDAENPLPLARTFHYHHPAMGGRNVLFVPFAGGWRVDLQLFEEDDTDEYTGINEVRRWLPKVMGEKYADRITWVSTYQFLQVVCKSFTDVHGRVVLAGEAAHLFAPFGARGLNSGVPDAVFAARAIFQAMNESDPEAARNLVAQAAAARQKAAEYNRDAAGIALQHIQGRSLGMDAKRSIAASLSSVWPQMGRWLDEGPYGPKTGPAAGTKY